MLHRWIRFIFLGVLITCFNIVCLGLAKALLPQNEVWMTLSIIFMLMLDFVAWVEYDKN